MKSLYAPIRTGDAFHETHHILALMPGLLIAAITGGTALAAVSIDPDTQMPREGAGRLLAFLLD